VLAQVACCHLGIAEQPAAAEARQLNLPRAIHPGVQRCERGLELPWLGFGILRREQRHHDQGGEDRIASEAFT